MRVYKLEDAISNFNINWLEPELLNSKKGCTFFPKIKVIA
jgi:hypothetical protein